MKTEAQRPRPVPLTPAEVARRFNVTIVTVGKWADAGLLPSFRTPGGQRRFYEVDVDAAIEAGRPKTS